MRLAGTGKASDEESHPHQPRGGRATLRLIIGSNALEISARPIIAGCILADESTKQARRNPPLMSIPSGRFIVLDFETTGLSPAQGARVIEVSAREVVDGHAGDEFLTFIDPGIRVPTQITQITGITTAILRGAPTSLAEPILMRPNPAPSIVILRAVMTTATTERLASWTESARPTPDHSRDGLDV